MRATGTCLVHLLQPGALGVAYHCVPYLPSMAFALGWQDVYGQVVVRFVVKQVFVLLVHLLLLRFLQQLLLVVFQLVCQSKVVDRVHFQIVLKFFLLHLYMLLCMLHLLLQVCFDVSLLIHDLHLLANHHNV